MIGDGALGTWAALRDVFPARAPPGVLGAQDRATSSTRSPSACSPTAKKLLHEMMEAPVARRRPRGAASASASEFDAKYPKAVAKLDKRLGAPDRVL